MPRSAAKTAADVPRDRRGRWAQGESGNPKGRPKEDPRVRQLAVLLTQARYAGATVTVSFAPVAEVEV